MQTPPQILRASPVPLTSRSDVSRKKITPNAKTPSGSDEKTRNPPVSASPLNTAYKKKKMGTAANAAKKKYATGLSAVDLKLRNVVSDSDMFQ
ncbi:MAG: hypothetical protein WA642_19125, partial [Steroidobacteraceae bacterium]